MRVSCLSVWIVDNSSICRDDIAYTKFVKAVRRKRDGLYTPGSILVDTHQAAPLASAGLWVQGPTRPAAAVARGTMGRGGILWYYMIIAQAFW